MKYAIGIDIGGTKIACGIVNQMGDLIQHVIVPSDPSNREKMFEQVVLCVERLLDHSSIPLNEIYGIGAGVPGKVDIRNGIAVFQNNLPWSNFPFVKRIQDHFKIDHITIDNDVYMAAFAEWKAAQLTDDLFVYLTISTGVSTSIINGGEFVRGAGFSGELGLVPIYAPFMENKIERLEQIASGNAIEKYANQYFDKDQMTAEALFKRFYDGDATAEGLIDNITSSLVLGIYSINCLLDPHKIVIGGSVATSNPVLLEKIKGQLDSHLLAEQKHILNNISISTLGNNQGMIGAGLSVFK